MAYEKIDIHKIDLEGRKKLFKKTFPGKETEKVFEFLRLARIGDVNKGKKISEKRLIKYLSMLTPFFSNIEKKDFDKLEKADMLKFVENLESGKIKQRHYKKPYAKSTAVDIKLVARTYLKWRLPAEKYILLTDWISLDLKPTTPEVLTEAEVEKLFDACKTVEERFLIAILFDTGGRAEEILNIRNEDIITPTESFPYYKIDFKQEYSKTKGRVVGCYWKNSNKAISEYLATLLDRKPKSQVLTKTYDALRLFVSRLGKKVLKKRVYFHKFRKSSATHYASKLNRQQLCVRYGWKFSSDCPDIYISRAGMQEDEIKDVFVNTSLQVLEKQNQELETKYALLKDQQQKNQIVETKIMKFIDLVGKEFPGDKIKKLLEQVNAN